MTYGPQTLAGLTNVVGRQRESELVVAALMSGRHLLLEGPPGTGKSTLLRAIAEASEGDFIFAEGSAELTPARLAGHFDPAQVMTSGYVAEIWNDGPLTAALRDGALLYLEEINRIPEETLNLLVTVMSEGELTIPRLAKVTAAPGFRLVAAMNPFDAVGTARISSALYDRMCRISMDYQSAQDEVAIVAADTAVADPEFASLVVDLVRATRTHPEVRSGSSVRGAVDTVQLASDLATLRGTAPSDRATGLDAAHTALSGRLRMHESSLVSPEEVITELWDSIMTAPEPKADQAAGEPGKAGSRQPKAARTTES